MRLKDSEHVDSAAEAGTGHLSAEGEVHASLFDKHALNGLIRVPLFLQKGSCLAGIEAGLQLPLSVQQVSCAALCLPQRTFRSQLQDAVCRLATAACPQLMHAGTSNLG